MVSKTKIKNVILHILEKKGFHVTWQDTGNGYFIFDFGENSVTHFKLKECKGWKFGLWIRYISQKSIDEYKEKYSDTKDESKAGYHIEIFGQYINYIDKFKPSYSPISYSLEGFTKLEDPGNDDDDYGLLWTLLWKFISDISCIKNSPIFARAKFYDACDSMYKKENLITWFIHDWIYYHIEEPWRNFKEITLNKLICKYLTFHINLFHHRKVKVNYTFSKNVWPHFELNIRFKDNVSDDTMYKLYCRYFGATEKRRSSSIGFDKQIRVEHYESLDAKRSFYYPIKKEDD